MKYFSILASLLLTSNLTYGDFSQYPTIQEQPKTIHFHNRPLIKINGKTISLVDVVKKLDMQLLKNAPHVLSDLPSKHHYYSTNWRMAFNELIEQEMIKLDSEQLKFSISEADIRTELDSTIGLNLISKLDSIGITLEEAKQMVESEMMVRQMLWMKAYSKALQTVTPEIIKNTYAEVVKKDLLKQKEVWCYQVLTIKAKNPDKEKEVAQKAYTLLNSSDSIMTNVVDVLKTQLQSQQDFEVSISKDITVDSHSVSASHHEILTALKENEYSQPIFQTVRNSKEGVHKIYHLKNHTVESPQTFEQIAPNIKDKLIQMAADKEKTIYIESLKQKFFVTDAEVNDVAPKDYDPFILL